MGDLLLRWASQRLADGTGRLWERAGSSALYAPNLGRDRLIVSGDPRTVVTLVRAAVAELGPRVPVVGDSALVEEIAPELPEFDQAVRFGWMDTCAPVPAEPRAGWFDGDPAEIEALLAVANPDSWVWPGDGAARRWAAVRVDDKLAAVAADVWSAPEVGFLGGVGTHPGHRGTGLGGAVCAFLTRELVAGHGAAALVVGGSNTAAVRLYERLGYRYRPQTALRLTSAG
ncbi:ribosomal protein S18 acetylase RimI-like enzyme [Crossiella equi]|uniref:Ribosomal protein S18 acetylase RimI-like enzyme n=1 Tax=Crossiella equi TaxID=130796 RepID=A0ABS5AEF9_9PSEU|nr:GNAT family N-acetyltransferase [Crossiella equi]MBP2474960.1 ribosomal protein S18 acetylase RimI-like enzyme [Crossiella equi]